MDVATTLLPQRVSSLGGVACQERVQASNSVSSTEVQRLDKTTSS